MGIQGQQQNKRQQSVSNNQLSLSRPSGTMFKRRDWGLTEWRLGCCLPFRLLSELVQDHRCCQWCVLRLALHSSQHFILSYCICPSAYRQTVSFTAQNQQQFDKYLKGQFTKNIPFLPHFVIRIMHYPGTDKINLIFKVWWLGKHLFLQHIMQYFSKQDADLRSVLYVRNLLLKN